MEQARATYLSQKNRDSEIKTIKEQNNRQIRNIEVKLTKQLPGMFDQLLWIERSIDQNELYIEIQYTAYKLRTKDNHICKISMMVLHWKRMQFVV